MTIEKLTGEERELLSRGGGVKVLVGAKALRIIDQLTAALEAHEATQPFLREQLVSINARAEALQARVAELEREVESADAGRDSAFDLIEQKNNELDAVHEALETSKARVAKLEEEKSKAVSALVQFPQTDCRQISNALEALNVKTR